MNPKREVVVADALEWLGEYERGKPKAEALVVVLPDSAEVDMAVGDWLPWFRGAALSCFGAVERGNPVVFGQTDRLTGGQWIDKAGIIADAATMTGHRLTWHKIALRRDPEKIDLHRPTYSHILAYGGRPGSRTPDVIHAGRPLWRDGIGVRTAEFVMSWLYQQGVKTVINPFCGRGTLLAAANEKGLDAFGCDLDEGRANVARTISITSELTL